MRILVFGADGQLGADTMKVFSRGHTVIASTQKDADITDEAAVVHMVAEHKPELVINCAAYTKVDDSERHPDECFKVNAIGALYVARAAAAVDAPVVYISTGYVFDGSQPAYTERDVPHPIGIYGASKYAGELLTAIGNPQHYILRTSALYGSHASAKGYNFVNKILQIAKEKSEVRVVNDQRTAPTYTRDVAEKILELAEQHVPRGVYHVTNQGNCSWYEFACEIIRQSGIPARVVPITAKEYGSITNRAPNEILATEKLEKLLPPWQDALERYLMETQSTP